MPSDTFCGVTGCVSCTVALQNLVLIDSCILDEHQDMDERVAELKTDGAVSK